MFFARKMSWIAFSGFKSDLALVLIFPAVLDVLSEVTPVAQEQIFPC